MDQDIINKIKMLTEKAKSILNYDKVVLYGSFSNGTNNADSDIDVAFFVSETIENHWYLSAKLFELVDSIDSRIEPIIVYEKNDKSGFAKAISDNGIVVC